jgi:hypothetical protein
MKRWQLYCIFLFVLAVIGQRGLANEDVEYFAVFLEGQKVGYAIQSREVSNGKVTTSEKVSITVSRLGIPITIDTTETSIETTGGKPLSFELVQQLGAMTTKTIGTLDEQGKVNLTTTAMGSEQKGVFDWPDGAVMAEGMRLLTLKKGLKEGSVYTIKVFSAGIMAAVDAEIKIHSKQNVDLLGRVVVLTEVTTTMTIPDAGAIVSKSYVDDELRPQKMITSVAGMQVEMVACAKEFALGENDVLELIDKMFIPGPEPLDDVHSAKAITYLLNPSSDSELIIPSNDNQHVRRLENGKLIVTVAPVAWPSGVRFPYTGKDRNLLDAMKPNRFLQSDQKEIIELARRAVGSTKDSAEAVRKIEDFVANYVQNRNFSVGYASAAEVVASRQGDCSEFAVLTAAMCRAIGIPAQVVAGVAYVSDFVGLEGFGGHAWTQAYIGDRWVGLDAAFKATGRGGYDAGHIALAVGNGEPGGFFNVASTLGKFKIEKIIVNPED